MVKYNIRHSNLTSYYCQSQTITTSITRISTFSASPVLCKVGSLTLHPVIQEYNVFCVNKEIASVKSLTSQEAQAQCYVKLAPSRCTM